MKSIKKKKKMMMMMMRAYLPLDVIPNIFYRLPVESLFRFRCVCRSWCAIIDDPLFREMHTHCFMLDNVVDKQSGSGSDSDYSSVSFLILARLGKQIYHEFHFGDHYFGEDEDEELLSSSGCCYNVTKPIKHLRIPKFIRRQDSERTSIVGSCNGLVCYASSVPNKYSFLYVLYVFNPVTNEYLRIPTFDKSFNVDMSVNGFGYLPSTNEYKVVRICYNSYPDLGDLIHEHVEIYTLGSGEWRNIGEIPPIFTSFVRLPGVLVNEVLHWIDNNGKIALFDLETEMFRMVSSPSPLTLVSDNAHYYELGVMGGRRLCVIEHNIHKSVDIWVMDENTIGEGSNWRMEFKIPISREGSCCQDDDEFEYDWEEFDDYNFVTITRSGKVLLWYNGTWLVSYDPKTEEFTLHEDYKADPSWFEAVIHKKSFVSIKALGEEKFNRERKFDREKPAEN